MKYVIIFLSFIICADTVFAQQENTETKIFIVRHGEKETGKDPLLTASGNIRAGDLVRKLQYEDVQKIYVSNTRRTQNTGDSLRIQLNIDTVHYLADTLCDNLVDAIMQHSDFGKTILIIAHSNTIPQIIRKFGVKNYPYGDLSDNDFDDLFLITYKKGKPKLKKMKYGEKSGASAAMQ